jgi:hypothetical protein
MAARPSSKLPQDPDYWERLAREIREDAAVPLAAYAAACGRGREVWLDLLARRATWWVAAAAAASAILWLSLPPRGPSPALAWIEAALAPDGVAGTLVSGDTPPAVDTVMVHFPPAAGEEQRR